MPRPTGDPENVRYNFAVAMTALAFVLGLEVGPCEECGVAPYTTRTPANPRGKQCVYAHHDSYRRPLDIRWLCARCHRNWHVANGQAEGRREPITAEERRFWRAELRRRYTVAA
jgi:hypothetical protein